MNTKGLLKQFFLSVSLLLALAACQAHFPADHFDYGKSAALAKEQRERMDVAFFNDFVVRDMPTELWRTGASHPRGERIRKLAEAGFELAWLAEKFYDFDRMGYKKTPDAKRYWLRIEQLADDGDASAQCFIWRAAAELTNYGFFTPPQEDVNRSALYLEQAAAQGQAQCSGDWGNYRYEKEPAKRVELNLYGARKGCAQCMSRISTAYQSGNGVPKDISKAWCWANEATRASDSRMYENDRRYLLSDIKALKPNNLGRPEDLTQYRAGSHCAESAVTTISNTKPSIGE